MKRVMDLFRQAVSQPNVSVSPSTSSKAAELLTDYPSFTELLPYRYVDTASDLFINQGSLGIGLELGVLAGANETLVQHLADMLRDKLPDKTDVQCILWGHNKVGEMVDQAFDAQRQQGGRLQSLAEAGSRYYKQAAKSGFVTRHGDRLPLRDYRCFCFISQGVTYSQANADRLLALGETLKLAFDAIGIASRRLTAHTFLPIVSQWLQPEPASLSLRRCPYDEHALLNEQVVHPTFRLATYPTTVMLASDYEGAPSEDGETVVVPLTVTQWPEQFALWQGADLFANVLQKSQGIPCPFLLSVQFRLMPREQARSLANRRFLDLDRKANSSFAKFIPGTVKAAAEWKAIRDSLSNQSDRLVKADCRVLLYSSPDKHREHTAATTAAFKAQHIAVIPIWGMAMQGFLSTLPFTLSEGLYQDVKRDMKTMTTWNLANILPIVADTKGGKQGLIIPTFRHQFSCLNLFDPVHATDNYNLAVAASSGAGKSFLVQAIIQQTLSDKGKVWVIDIGGSYKKFCDAVGGTYLTARNLQLNPFTHVESISESAEMIRDLLCVMASPNDGLTGVQLSYLQQAVETAFAREGQAATIDTVVAAIFDQEKADPDSQLRRKDLATLLQVYCQAGTKGRFFNGHSALAPEADFVVLDLIELSKQPDLMKAVLFSLILYISQQMYHSPRNLRKMCVIDEAWRLLKGSNKAAADFIELGFRTARRHMGTFVAISQSLKDFHTSIAAKAAWDNSSFKLTMRQDEQAFPEFVRENPGVYTAYEERLIKGFQQAKANGYSEFMLSRGPVNTFHRLFTDPFARVMYSSAGDEFQAVEQYLEAGLPIEEAIYRVAIERYPEEMQG